MTREANHEPRPVALVTGGNRGLGLETCRQLAQRGHRVILTSRDPKAGERAAGSLVEEGLPAETRPLDVENQASVAALAADLSRNGVALNVLVNNAGLALDGFDSDVARRTLDVNLFGVIRVTDACLSLIVSGGTIVMVSSGMGSLDALSPELRRKFLDPWFDRKQLIECMHSFVRDVELGRHSQAGWPSSAYRVSKAGLNAFVRILARELAPRRIRVNAVCPGWVRTRMGGENADRSVEQGAASILWAATEAGNHSGGFFRDGRPISW